MFVLLFRLKKGTDAPDQRLQGLVRGFIDYREQKTILIPSLCLKTKLELGLCLADNLGCRRKIQQNEWLSFTDGLVLYHLIFSFLFSVHM